MNNSANRYIQTCTNTYNTYKSGIVYFQNTCHCRPDPICNENEVQIISFESGKCKINLNTILFSLLFPEETI